MRAGEYVRLKQGIFYPDKPFRKAPKPNQILTIRSIEGVNGDFGFTFEEIINIPRKNSTGNMQEAIFDIGDFDMVELPEIDTASLFTNRPINKN